jgi:chromosome segregation ATPase
LENGLYEKHASDIKDQPRGKTSTRAVESFHVDTSTLGALLRRAEAELIVLREENEVKEKELLRVLAALHSAQTREGQLQRVIASHEAQLNIVHEALSQSHYDMDVVHTEINMLKSRPRMEEEQLGTALIDLARCKAENEELCEKAAMLDSLEREKEDVIIELKEKIENLQQHVENMERRPKDNRSRVAVQSILRVVATIRVLVALTSCI